MRHQACGLPDVKKSVHEAAAMRDFQMKKSAPLFLSACLLAWPPAAASAKKHVHVPGATVMQNGEDSPDSSTPLGPAPVPDSPAGDKSTPTPPTLPGMTAYVLMDAATGTVLAEAAPNLAVAPASLTKLMTAHITYQALHGGSLKLTQTVPVSPEAWHAGGSRMFIDPTSVVTVDQLLHGLIIDSGNDAAVALAEQIAGSQDAFVQIMNKDAAAFGLKDTNYTNVTGLPDPALHTTAMDVAILTRDILQDEPEILSISKLQSYSFNNITQASWNPVLAHDSTVDGLKTGLTQESGHCIDATAVRSGGRLIAVVMGGPTWHASTAAIESLLNYGEKFFAETRLATAGIPIETLQSPALDTGSVAVGAADDIVLTLPADAAHAVTHTIAYNTDLAEGAKKGETLGTITYTLDGKIVATSPAIALADAPPASFMTKLQRKLSKML
jgi:D-alanyl-D-alanine carboxypeptidase (penicillin-binding protein 5/6)